MFRRLFVLELKKNLKQLPFVCIAGALLAVFLSGIVIFAIRLFESESSLLEVRMAVVSEQPDDPYLDMMMGYVAAVSDSSENYTFSLSGSNFEKNRELVMYSRHMVLTLKMMEEDQARSELENGKSLGILYLPANLTYDILVGNETSVRIELSDVKSIDALMITELTSALGSLLCSAQADDYAIAELYETMGIPEEKNDALIHMDMINGINVAQRSYLYDTRLITPGGLTDTEGSASSTILYFASCGLILLIFFSFVGFSPALTAESPEFYEILGARHLPFAKVRYVLCKFCANLCIFGTLLTFLWTVAYLILSAKGIDYIPSWIAGTGILWISAMLCASICVFLFLILRSAPAAILTFFAAVIGMSFISGYFIPAAYLPAWLGRIGSLLPTHALLELWNKANGMPAENTLWQLCLWIVFFLGLSVFFSRFERRTRS